MHENNKKAGIVTFYDANNYGAFWQAKCLNDYINNMGNISCNILRIALRKDRLRILKQVAYFASHKIKFTKMLYEIKRYRKFQKYSEMLKPQSKYRKYDIYIFGSDELWNVRRKINRTKKARILWGIGLQDSTRKISYAPSVNEANESDFEKIPIFKENVSKFDSLSARDTKSVEVLEKVLGKKIELVLDPTLLQNSGYFEKYEAKEDEIENEKFILLYVYNSLLTEKEVTLIKDFAKEKKLRIISIGDYIEFADNSFLCTPEQFLTYFKKASYVFTNTFHGTMFSIIYRKKCGILDEHQIKVEDAIEMLRLDELRLFEADEVWNLDDKDWDGIWSNIYEVVNDYRIKSREFLEKEIST